MAIKVYEDKIEFDTYTLSITGNGLEFDGTIKANAIQSFNYTTLFPSQLGETQGFTSGGYVVPSNVVLNTIDKFPFASDAPASDHGDLSRVISRGSAHTSATDGYTGGGKAPGPYFADITKFSFASNVTGTDHGDLTEIRQDGEAAGMSSGTTGYSAGGGNFTAPLYATNTIDKFPFASSAGASDAGDITNLTRGATGISSGDTAYITGGRTSGNYGSGRVEKFPFAADGGPTTLALTLAPPTISLYMGGHQSGENAYTSGGGGLQPFGGSRNNIYKFSFASESPATSVATLLSNKMGIAGVSSTASGYAAGGRNIPGSSVNVIEKFPFASDTPAADVGDLTGTKQWAGGHQD